MKKALAGILSTAMIFTSGVIPNTLTSVQAATTYNDTTTALSSLAGSTGLKMYELTSSDAGAQLSNGIYYMNSDLTLNEDKSPHILYPERKDTDSLWSGWSQCGKWW